MQQSPYSGAGQVIGTNFKLSPSLASFRPKQALLVAPTRALASSFVASCPALFLSQGLASPPFPGAEHAYCASSWGVQYVVCSAGADLRPSSPKQDFIDEIREQCAMILVAPTWPPQTWPRLHANPHARQGVWSTRERIARQGAEGGRCPFRPLEEGVFGRHEWTMVRHACAV